MEDATGNGTAKRRVQLQTADMSVTAPEYHPQSAEGTARPKKRGRLQELLEQPVKRTKTAAPIVHEANDGKKLNFEVKCFHPLQPLENYCPVYHFGESSVSSNDDMHENMNPRSLDDMAVGYDSQDSFVDNEDVAPEAIIPPGWTTQLGGHYIGSGKLYIRPLSPDEVETGLFNKTTAAECRKAMKALKKTGRKRKGQPKASAFSAVVDMVTIEESPPSMEV